MSSVMSRILHITLWYRESKGGIGTMIHTLVEGDQSSQHLVLRNCSAEPEIDGSDSLSLYIPSFDILSFSPRSWVAYTAHAIKAVYQLTKIIKNRGINCIHIHYPTGSSILIALSSALTQIPFIVTFHGSDLLRIRDMARWKRMLVTTALRRGQRLVSVSEFIKRDALELVGQHTNHLTVYNGVRIDSASLATAAGSTDGLPFPSGSYFLFSGIPKPIKGADVLLKAWASFSQQVPEANLVIIGAGWEHSELLRDFPWLKDRQSVKIMGLVDPAHVLRLISHASAVVAPSRREGLGYILLEAGICKTPVIATTVGGIPEVIEHQKTGLLVRSEDDQELCKAMKQLYDSPSLGRELGRNLRKRVESDFSQSAMTRAYTEIYQAISRI